MNEIARTSKLNLNPKVRLRNLNWDLDRIVSEVIGDNEALSWLRNGEEISSRDFDCLVVQYILALEDRRFNSHVGAELRAIPRTFRRLLTGKGLGGISTIDQQLVRIITNRRERTLARKVRETILALAINTRLSKSQILVSYLKRSYFGKNANGVSDASHLLFNKRPQELDPNEAAFVASLLARPIPGSVVNLYENVHFLTKRSPDNYIGLARLITPTWAIGVRNRYLYAKSLSCRIKQPKDQMPKRDITKPR